MLVEDNVQERGEYFFLLDYISMVKTGYYSSLGEENSPLKKLLFGISEIVLCHQVPVELYSRLQKSSRCGQE